MAVFAPTELGLYAPHNPIGACTVDDRYCFFFGNGDEFAIFDSVAGTSKAYSGIGTATFFRPTTVDDNGDVWTMGNVGGNSSLIRVEVGGSVLVKPSSVVSAVYSSIFYEDGALWTGAQSAGRGVVRWDRSALTNSGVKYSQKTCFGYDGIVYVAGTNVRYAVDGTALANSALSIPDVTAAVVTPDGTLAYSSGSTTVGFFNLPGNASLGSVTVPSGIVSTTTPAPSLGSDGLIYVTAYTSPYKNLVVIDPVNLTTRTEEFTTGRAERLVGTSAGGVMYFASGEPDPR